MSAPYSQRKRALGLPETALDTGFGHDDTAEYPRVYLTKGGTGRVKPPPLTEDFSALKGGQRGANEGSKSFWRNLSPEAKAEIMAKRRATRGSRAARKGQA